MTSIALTNDNNCQNQGKGCSTPTPTRLVGIFQRAFEEQVKKKVKRKLSQSRGHSRIENSSFRTTLFSERERKRSADEQRVQSFSMSVRAPDKRTESYGEFRPPEHFDDSIIPFDCALSRSLCFFDAR